VQLLAGRAAVAGRRAKPGVAGEPQAAARPAAAARSAAALENVKKDLTLHRTPGCCENAGMLLFVAVLGGVLAVCGLLLLIRYPDRSGGVVKLLGLEVSSTGAGLPLSVLGAALVAAALAAQGRERDHNPPVGCKFDITAPNDGERITNRGGTVVEGTACSTDNIWILDYPTDDEGYYYRKTEKPVDVIGEQWSATDEPIGASFDPVGSRYRIVAVRADRMCSQVLGAAHPDQTGTVRFRGLPAKCRPRDAGNVQSVVVVKKKA
jgi:hypothetical protein